jgi:hypothetical protein
LPLINEGLPQVTLNFNLPLIVVQSSFGCASAPAAPVAIMLFVLAKELVGKAGKEGENVEANQILTTDC